MGRGYRGSGSLRSCKVGEEEGEGQRQGGSQKEGEAVGGDEGAAPRAPPSQERVRDRKSVV